MKQLTLLGSTGSIGCSTLDVVRHNPDHYSVAALVAGKNVSRMVEQCLEFTPRYAVMDDDASARQVKALLAEKGSRTEVLSGPEAACEMAALDDVDQVMAAIVGAVKGGLPVGPRRRVRGGTSGGGQGAIRTSLTGKVISPPSYRAVMCRDTKRPSDNSVKKHPERY